MTQQEKDKQKPLTIKIVGRRDDGKLLVELPKPRNSNPDFLSNLLAKFEAEK